MSDSLAPIGWPDNHPDFLAGYQSSMNGLPLWQLSPDKDERLVGSAFAQAWPLAAFEPLGRLASSAGETTLEPWIVLPQVPTTLTPDKDDLKRETIWDDCRLLTIASSGSVTAWFPPTTYGPLF